MLIACVFFCIFSLFMLLSKFFSMNKVEYFTKTRLMKALVWPVATYGCESWTLRKHEETRLDAFIMKGLKKHSASGFLTKLE